MNQDELLAQIGKLIDAKLQTIKDEQQNQGKQLATIGSKLETLELNVEILRSESKKAHTEIIENLVTSNEIKGKQLKDLENRVTHVEEDSQVPKSH